MLSPMEVSGVSSAATVAAQPAASARPSAVGAFSAALGDQRRRVAAHDVMTSMPPMVAEQIQRSSPGGKPPVGAVDALFKAIQSGEFRPSGEQMAASDSLIATTARAVQSFDSAEQMWDAMREMLGSMPAPAGTTSYLATPAAAPASPAASAGGGTASEAMTAAPPAAAPAQVTTRAQAEAIIGSPLSALQLNWWETAIHFLLDEAKAASLRASTMTPQPAKPAPADTKPMPGAMPSTGTMPS